MIYTAESLLLRMPTPGEMLQQVLDETGLEKTELGKRLGLGNAYLTVHRWTKDRGFSEDSQRRVEDELGLPRGYFTQPNKAVQREIYRKRIFDEFLASELGQSLASDEKRVLETMKFRDELLPTVALYQGFLLAMRGHATREQLIQAIELNERLDESLKGKEKPGRS